ncbi:hypothetical protein [uncultured Sphingomonas sp.]|uniref:hypothetical protein n=1 Tax=uncultured Sphingomonas sp. TaxID=158754 RepID=UPI0025E0BCF6|nr:hypothetical protein [uncultured Sphingomonas sp.]
MLVRVRPGAPLPVKNGYHAHYGRFRSPDGSLEQLGRAGNCDSFLIDRHFGDEEGNIGLAEHGIVSAQAVANECAESIHHLRRHTLRGLADLPFERFDRRGRRGDAVVRFRQQAGEDRILERCLAVRQRLVQVAQARLGLGLVETGLSEIAGTTFVRFG